MGRSTAAEAEITRQKIIDAAFEISISEGFNKASLRAIAERVGITKSGVTAHFSRKEHIALELAPIYSRIIKAPLQFHSVEAFFQSWKNAIDSNYEFNQAIITAGPIIPNLSEVRGLFDSINGEEEDIQKCVYMCIGYAVIHASVDW